MGVSSQQSGSDATIASKNPICAAILPLCAGKLAASNKMRQSMKTQSRHIAASIACAKTCIHKMPWTRGARRAAMIARRNAPRIEELRRSA